MLLTHDRDYHVLGMDNYYYLGSRKLLFIPKYTWHLAVCFNNSKFIYLFILHSC